MEDFEQAKPENEEIEESIPFDDDSPKPSISHSPLDLGGAGGSESAQQQTQPESVTIEKKVSKGIVSWPDRITGVKTFFTKLHGGAIEFLDEQISDWLKENPGVQVKRTNTVTGDVIGKKIEPNIIITIWY